MPTLHWIGKNKVIHHHMDVPFKTLEHSYGFNNGEQTEQETRSGNKIIHGDNLEALKALLPEYAGRIKCIYIDPPYNTGNESWVYNDNVNDPKIKKWLGQVVGKEAEDLTRHDKWLCMMYPRLKLLHKLLADDGAIFISIDDNEQANLKLICDEIFGGGNFIETLIWKKRATAPNDRIIGKNHEYITVYSKSKANIKLFLQPRTEKLNARYSNPDNDPRGLWVASDLSANGKGGRIVESLIFSIKNPLNGKEYFPPKNKCWLYNQDKINNYLQANKIGFRESSGTPFLKRFLLDVRQGQTLATIIDTGGFSQDSAIEQKKIFEKDVFEFPKPTRLLEKLLFTGMSNNDIVLDSFAGSGTTANAVLNLNKLDNGNRKFILIQVDETNKKGDFTNIAESVTAERIKRVIKGYGTTEGTGGSFDFYELGQPIFLENGNLNEAVGVAKIRQYVYYAETKMPLIETKHKDNKHFLGKHNDTAYYFNYEPDEATTLDEAFLAAMKAKAERYVIYADHCLLTKKIIKERHIVFKKIPRSIIRF